MKCCPMFLLLQATFGRAVPVVLKKPIVVLKDNRDNKGQQCHAVCIYESYQLIFCILLKTTGTTRPKVACKSKDTGQHFAPSYSFTITYSSVREKEPALLAPLAPSFFGRNNHLQPEPAAFLAKPAAFLAKPAALQLFHSVE